MKNHFNVTIALSLIFFLLSQKAYGQISVSGSTYLVIGSGSYLLADKGVINTNTADDAIKLSGTLRITGGDLKNNAAAGMLLNGSTGTVEFTGSATQGINGSRAIYFNNLLINNTSAGGITHTSVQNFVSGTLTLTDGIINTDAGHELVMQAGSSYSGGSDASHIDGPMTKIGSTNFSFPVGNGGYIEQIGIEDLASSETFTAQYHRATPANYSNFTGDSIQDVSSEEYWDIHPASGSPTINLVLQWNSGTFSGINNPENLLGAHYSGGVWHEVAYISSTGNSSSGTIKFGPVSSYSSFTFGSKDNVNDPLPIELLNFDAKKYNSIVNVIWATATEFNNDYFNVERSADGVIWEIIGTLKGAGNSNSIINYNLYDNNPLQGTNYYRLKQFDFDGRYAYSDIRLVEFNSSGDALSSVVLYPNPTHSAINIKGVNANTTYKLLNATGKVVMSGAIHDLERLNIKELSSGLYSLILMDNSYGVMKTFKIIKE